MRTPVAAGLVLLLAACTSAQPAARASSPAAVPSSALASATAAAVPAALVATTVKGGDGHKVQAPPGWTVSVWAHVPDARLLAWAPDGRLLVSSPGNGSVYALTSAGKVSTLVSGLNQPHGLAFHGSTLYVSDTDQLLSFTYTAGGPATGKKVLVSGLPSGGAHPLKTVVVGPDGSIYYSIGSSANIAPADRTTDPQRAAIYKLAPGRQPLIFARGVRNGTGLAFDPSGALWTAVNNRDNLAFPYARDYDGDGKSDKGKVLQSYVNDHPLEPVARLTQGRDLGWPFCNPDPDAQPGVKGTALTYTNRPYVNDMQTNPSGASLDCATLAPPEQGLPAHSAPLGMSFATSAGAYGAGALVGVHGSWNRQPPRPPSVAFFPWRDGTLGVAQTILAGFQNADGSRWGRPVMAVQGPDHALYVSDDQSGVIYRVTMN